jgi:hypothetical protein
VSGEGRPTPGGPAASRRRFLLTAGGALAAAVGVTGVLDRKSVV